MSSTSRRGFNAIEVALQRSSDAKSLPLGDDPSMNLKRITAEEAKRLMDGDGYTLLDVRSMPEYTAEHPQGAFNVPYLHKAPQGMIPNTDFSRIVQALFPDKSAKLITSCQMGGRSVRAAMELTNLGYTNIADLRGGFGSERDEMGNVVVKGWKDSGLPTETGETAGKNYREIQMKTNAAKEPQAPAADPSCGPTPAAPAHAGHGQQ